MPQDSKYISFGTLDKETQFVVVFPNCINHDEMSHGVRRAIRKSPQKLYVAPLGAGFVTKDLECYGESLTLGIKSRKQDTEILQKQL